jgi:site-specific DNA-cytosine methylase
VSQDVEEPFGAAGVPDRRPVKQRVPFVHGYVPALAGPSQPAKDAPRYRAIGNSMAVPCIAWLGQRLLRSLPDESGGAEIAFLHDAPPF